MGFADAQPILQLLQLLELPEQECLLTLRRRVHARDRLKERPNGQSERRAKQHSAFRRSSSHAALCGHRDFQMDGEAGASG
jgi:hypothetical protein